MKWLRKKYVLRTTIGGLACLLIVFLIWSDPRFLLVNWRAFEDLPFDVDGDLELATRWAPLKRSSLSLVCAVGGDLHLVMRTRMSGRSFMKVSFYDKATIFIDGIDNGFEIDKLELVHMDFVDTFVTESLSSSKLDSLARRFGSTPPQRIGLVTMEHGMSLVGVTNGDSIRMFISRCSSEDGE